MILEVIILSTFICDKCRTCAKFPFCGVKESLDGNCGTYLKRIKPVEVVRYDSKGKGL